MPPKLKLLIKLVFIKIIMPVAFISFCVGVNAIAFTEIKQSLQARRTRLSAPANNSTNNEESSSEPVTIQSTAAVEPQSNQLVSVPTQTEQSDTQIALRPVNKEGFINDPQPIPINPVLDEATKSKDKHGLDASPDKKIPEEISAEGSDKRSLEELPEESLDNHGSGESSKVSQEKVSQEKVSQDNVEALPPASKANTPPDSSIKSSQSIANQQSTPQIASQEQAKYGHLRYAEGEADEMMLVASYAEGVGGGRPETLHPEAAKALHDMIAAARVDGIWLIPASGFRTIAEQRTLFNAQIERKGSPEVAAQISAPPGYSEHHTGYAVDLADGSLPQSQDISEQFAQTAAYQWLLENAKNHGFELSFPEDNLQGIAFEPWHWRYVGSTRAREQLNLQAPTQLPTADTRNTTGAFIE